MNRTSFYNIVTVNGIQEYDFLDNNISKFVMTYPVSYYRVTDSDMMRMDLISYKIYGSEDYWWIIAMVNEINDIFHDMQVGQLLKIPNILDIYSFYKKYSK